MSSRYWNGPLAFVVLALVLLAAWSWIVWHAASERQLYATTAQHHSERAEQDTTAKLQNCFRQRTGVYQCIEAGVAAKHETQRSEYDLAAQQEMAYWTPWITLSSIVTALAAVIGLGALAYQNNLAREAAFQAQRAWIRFDASLASGIAKDGNSKIRVSIAVTVENVGVAPANHVTTHVSALGAPAAEVAAKHLRRIEGEAVESNRRGPFGATIFRGHKNEFEQVHVVPIVPVQMDYVFEVPDKEELTWVSVVVVVVYRTPSDTRVLKTSRVFEVHRPIKGSEIVDGRLSDMPIRLDELIMSQSHFTGQAQ